MSSRNSKRARSKQGASSSRHPYQDGSVLFFESDEELTRFLTKFEKRLILPPRFSTNALVAPFIPAANMLRECNLFNFLLLTHPYYNISLVEAFYSNLHKDDEGELVTNVNGISILISEDNLHLIAGIPHDGEDIYQYINDAGDMIDEANLFRQAGVAYDESSSRRPTIKGMDPNYRFILYFITRVLKPRKLNHTTISQEDAKFLHAIITGVKINWCKLIQSHMFNATRDDIPLPYALLIMKFLEASGVNIANGPLKKSTKIWEISESSFHHDGDHAPAPPQNRQARRAHPPQEPTLRTISDQITQLTREVHGYFDHVHYAYAQVVPYQAPPNDDEGDGGDE